MFRALAPTVRYWMQTEVHVFAFSISANVLLSFFPFLIVSISLARIFLDQKSTVDIIDFSYKHWHKLTDVPENCSPEGMEQVAKVLTTWLIRIKNPE